MKDKKIIQTAEPSTATTERSEKRKFSRRKLKHGSMAYAMSAIFIVVLILINLVATELFERFPITFDMTSTGAYSVSDTTVDYLETIDTDITFYVMATEPEFTALSLYTVQANEILKKYAQHNSHIKIEYKDLLTNPDFVAGYTENISKYDIIVQTTMQDENGSDYNRVKIISLLDLVDFGEAQATAESYASYYGEDYVISYFSGYVTGSLAEQEFTSALMIVTDANPVFCTVATYPGANETDISALTTMLIKNGYQLSTIDIQTEAIPDETSVLIIPAPKVDYGADEVKKISDYLNNGGNLEKDMLYIASVEQPALPNLEALLEEYGIEVQDALIVETKANYYYNYPNFTFMFSVSDSYKQDISNPSLSMLVPNCVAINALWEDNGMKTTDAFISSSSGAVLCPFDAPDTWTIEDAVDRGVFNAMVVGSKATFMEDNSTAYSNVAVIGSDQFFDPTIFNSSSMLNGEFFLSFMNGITRKSSTGVTIVPKTFSAVSFDITEAQKNVLKWLFIGIIPVAVLTVGIVVWVRRRNR